MVKHLGFRTYHRDSNAFHWNLYILDATVPFITRSLTCLCGPVCVTISPGRPPNVQVWPGYRQAVECGQHLGTWWRARHLFSHFFFHFFLIPPRHLLAWPWRPQYVCPGCPGRHSPELAQSRYLGCLDSCMQPATRQSLRQPRVWHPGNRLSHG